MYIVYMIRKYTVVHFKVYLYSIMAYNSVHFLGFVSLNTYTVVIIFLVDLPNFEKCSSKCFMCIFCQFLGF